MKSATVVIRAYGVLAAVLDVVLEEVDGTTGKAGSFDLSGVDVDAEVLTLGEGTLTGAGGTVP